MIYVLTASGGAARDRKTIDFPLKSRRKVSMLYPGRLESAVWPGPHALTTRVKRCEPANTGAGRCGPGHTKQGCLSSGVAGVALIFPLRPPKASKIIENHMYYHAFHEFLSRLAYNRARFRGNPRTKARRESIDLVWSEI